MRLYPKLSLVGAGPGDPELISIKAVKTLQSADIVLYDALVDTELLNYAPAEVPKIFVGKRPGKHSMKQTEINELIISSAFRFGHVVRLKGGDPMIFGRGREELEYVESYGIEVNIIPGISSVTCLTALHGIPLTKRGLAESFWVVTGTTKDNTISDDIKLAAESTSTIVILMGMKRVAEIMEIFKQYNKHSMPVMVIENGSKPMERIGCGTVANIETVVKESGLSSPAIIIVGKVAGLHKVNPFKQSRWSNLEQSIAI